MSNPEYTRLDSLEVGDTFWFFGRGFIIREKLQKGIRCECLDDGGTPLLQGANEVEVVTRASQ